MKRKNNQNPQSPAKNILNWCKKHFILLSFFSLLAIFRLALVPKGHLYWIDELRYLNAFNFLQLLQANNIKDAVAALFNAEGRPGYIFFCIIPAAIQSLCLKWGWISIGNNKFFIDLFVKGLVSSKCNPHFFNIPSAFNAVITLLNSFIFYKILCTLTKDKFLSITGCIIYSLLWNSNVYIRHLVPYDLSLLFFLIVLYFITKSEEHGEWRSAGLIWAGLMVGLAFLIYPGNYLFVIFLTSGISVISPQKIRHVFLFLTSALLPLVLTEALAQYAGVSALENFHKLSANVNQGSYQEGFTLLLKYMYFVEGPIGVAILTLFLYYIIFVSWKHPSVFKSIIFAAVACFLYQGSMAVFFHKTTVYGRFVHMYLPPLVGGAMLAVFKIKNERWKKGVLSLLLIISFLSFIQYAPSYLLAEYPLDMQYWFQQRYPEIRPFKANEMVDLSAMDFQMATAISLNVGKVDEVPAQFYPFTKPKYMRLVKSAVNPCMFAPYQYEGYKIHDRQHLKKFSIQMKYFVSDFLYKIMHENHLPKG